jgi:hypothetical protein
MITQGMITPGTTTTITIIRDMTTHMARLAIMITAMTTPMAMHPLPPLRLPLPPATKSRGGKA